MSFDKASFVTCNQTEWTFGAIWTCLAKRSHKTPLPRTPVEIGFKAIGSQA